MKYVTLKIGTAEIFIADTNLELDGLTISGKTVQQVEDEEERTETLSNTQLLASMAKMSGASEKTIETILSEGKDDKTENVLIADPKGARFDLTPSGASALDDKHRVLAG